MVVLAAKAAAAEMAAEVPVAALVLAELAVAQAAECSPDRAALAAKVAEPKLVRSEVPETKAEEKAEPERTR